MRRRNRSPSPCPPLRQVRKNPPKQKLNHPPKQKLKHPPKQKLKHPPKQKLKHPPKQKLKHPHPHPPKNPHPPTPKKTFSVSNPLPNLLIGTKPQQHSQPLLLHREKKQKASMQPRNALQATQHKSPDRHTKQ